MSSSLRTVFALLLISGRASAQAPPVRPPSTPDAYVLLGLSKIDVSNSIQVTTGSVGVNRSGGTLQGNNVVTLNAQDGVLAASTVRLTQPSTCAALFANSGNGAGQCQAVQPIPSPQPPLVSDLTSSDLCRLPDPFPSCSSEAVTIDAGTVRMLAPGTYGALTINGGTLELQGGQYVFCNVNVNNGSVVTVAAPSTLLVGDRFNVQPNARINALGTPADLRVQVKGLGVNVSGSSNSNLVFPGTPAAARDVEPQAVRVCQFTNLKAVRGGPSRTTIVAQVCAPSMNAQMNLFGIDASGTFIADAINVGDLSGQLGPLIPTTTTTVSTSTSTTVTTTSSSTTSTTSSSTSTSTSTSTSSTTSTSTTTTSVTTSSSSTSPPTSSTAPTSTTSSSSTTSTSSSTSTSTSSSTSTSTSSSSTSTSSSTSVPVSPTTSTTLPPCNDLRVTAFRFVPKKSNPTKGRLVIRGVLADSGWADVDPRTEDVTIGLTASGATSCCTIDQQFWTLNFSAHFGFFDQSRSICPPLTCASLVVRRDGSAGFTITVPGVELSDEMLKDIQLGFVIGEHCSTGQLSLVNLRRKGRSVVYP